MNTEVKKAFAYLLTFVNDGIRKGGFSLEETHMIWQIREKVNIANPSIMAMLSAKELTQAIINDVNKFMSMLDTVYAKNGMHISESAVVLQNIQTVVQYFTGKSVKREQETSAVIPTIPMSSVTVSTPVSSGVPVADLSIAELASVLPPTV